MVTLAVASNSLGAESPKPPPPDSLSKQLGANAPASASVVGAVTGEAADRCTALGKLAMSGVTIMSAQAVAPGPFKGPFMPAEAQLPAHCRVQATVSGEPGSEIRFEVWMPLDGWNGRLYGAGNGGFAGAISYSPGLVEPIQRGAAAVATDTGHFVDSPAAAVVSDWAQGRPERIKDYAHRGIHLATVNAKHIVTAYFGKAPTRSYFASCSNGGRQALMEAQRYPEDYDGIIAGAPSNYFTGLAANFIWNARAQASPGAAIAPTKVPALQAAVLKACGSGGSYVQNPQQCDFKPASMLCQQQENDQCLTAAQVTALEKIYSGPVDGKGQRLFPGFARSGAELGQTPGSGWEGWLFAPQGAPAAQALYASALLKHFVTGVKTDIARFDFDRDFPAFKGELAPVLDAADPDLSRFAARGGRLILWHGWADPGIPPESTIEYAEQVRAKLGERNAAQVMRLFMVPGVQHCFGGPGPSNFGQFTAPSQPADARYDMAASLERWVEEGVAPEQLIAHYSANPLAALNWRDADPGKTALLCAHPKVAVRGKDGQEACVTAR